MNSLWASTKMTMVEVLSAQELTITELKKFKTCLAALNLLCLVYI